MSSNDINHDTASGPMSIDSSREWRGMTLDELRKARGKALVKREVGRAAMQYDIEGMKNTVATNGVRGLMFSPGTVTHLKTADYVLLGFKLARWIRGMRNDRRRRR
jgi:hypothetical protein